MSSDEEIEEEVENDPLNVVGTYKHGSIRRIKLHNFLTYTDVECRPGPRYVYPLCVHQLYSLELFRC